MDKPNSGKSNIFEALGLQSQNNYIGELDKNIFWYKPNGDLYYDSNINTSIKVITEQKEIILSYALKENNIPENEFHLILEKLNSGKTDPIKILYNGKITNFGNNINTNIIHY